jgi:transcription elongation factor SPT6
MKAGQAEQFLASQPRGEVVIRPSSKGPNYLALTIKLDEDIFSHVDVEEIDKPSDYQLGAKLRVAGKYVYNDLDEIVVHYVMPVMRMLEQAERHEKWKPEAELGMSLAHVFTTVAHLYTITIPRERLDALMAAESYLKNTLLAFPNRSMYAFALDSEPKRAGCLKLAFLNKATKDGGKIQYWPVRLLPGAYKLGPAELPGMLELCNAFKLQYSNQLANQGAGGKTPGIRAGRTPAHGGRTPAVGGRTPAPGYAMGIGGKTPMPNQMGGQTPYGQVNPVMGTPLRPGMTPNACE